MGELIAPFGFNLPILTVGMSSPHAISPIRVLLLVLGVVFTVEALIMLGITAAFPKAQGTLAVSLVDALVLVAVLCPALWLLVVRPLRALVSERGALLVQALRMQEEERARLARDLHDELGQSQTAILLGLRSIRDSSTLDQAKERAGGVHQMAVEAVESARRMARGLSPSVLTDFGLGPAVERVCEDLSAASGIDVVRDIRIGSTRLDPALEISTYRVIQEALTNSVRHAGASSARVSLHIANGRLLLSVQDNGQGMADALNAGERPRKGLGVVGMRERVVLLHGTFGISSTPSGGTQVNASIPLLESAS
jgi:two-component system sensor histidine kinase UhpB